jgi:hypothetical protein
MGQGEDDMVMRAGQQAGLLLGQPALDLQPGIWRAYSMFTGIIPDPFQMPLRTGLDMTTEQGCTTRQHRLDRMTNISRQSMALLKHFITLLQNTL